MIELKDKFSGCIIGQCLGDAVGFVTEGYSPQASIRYVEDYLKTGLAAELGRFPFAFGQYSDDSQLARELMQSYVACKKFDPADYANRIAMTFIEKRIVAFGYSTKESVKRLCCGISWQESGTPPPAAGNGSAMRAAPIGLFFYDNPEMLIKAAQDQGRITHQDPRSLAGAVAISGAVALVLTLKSFDQNYFLLKLEEWTEKISYIFSSELKKLSFWLTLSVVDAFEEISKAGYDEEFIDDDEWKGISGYVVSSVLWSLYSFLKNPYDYMETICTAISGGGDTDTTAAMAGAISGAFLGINAIPSNLTKYLTDRQTWGLNELVELAHKCYEIKMNS